VFEGVSRDQLNPVQQRVLTDLLAVDTPRPAPLPEAVSRIRRMVQEQTTPAADLVPDGARGVTLNKSALTALDCDGRYLDREQTPFSWTPEMVRGTLAHTGIEVDLDGQRRRTTDEVLEYAWQRFAVSGKPAGGFLGTLNGPDADALRGEAKNVIAEFRDTFPQLPSSVEVRSEPELRHHLHDRRVTLVGKPDLLLGRATTDRRRMLLVDLKTGRRNHLHDRADMRFYALLTALKYGVAPFRVATVYLAEGDWDYEDVEEATLEAAARTVVEKAARAARLAYDPPAEEELRLVPGPACNWCGRAPTCPALSSADADGGE
jgi:hypothetical protein